MNKLATIICISILALISTACAVTSDAVNPMLHHSEESKVLGETWVEGSEQLEKGRALVAQGKDQIDEGENNVEKGLALIKEGMAKVKASEAAFNKLLTGPAIQE